VPALVAEHLEWHRRFPEEEAAIAGHVRWARELRETPFMKWLDRGMQFNFPAVKGIEANYALLYGANSSLKRSFIERVGDWDEVYLPYLYDDLDWSYRAEKHGLRVMYNRAAIVDHLRHDAELGFWKRKMRRLAFTERQFTAIHPEFEPWFFNLFSWAAQLPEAHGRGRHLAWVVGRDFPWLGERVWESADLYFKQQLAPHFLDAWEEFVGLYGEEAVPDPDYVPS
jgi:GT2 family glycosyltransferase